MLHPNGTRVEKCSLRVLKILREQAKMDSEHHLNGLSENAVDVSVKKATSKFFVSMLHEPRKPFKHRIRLSRVSAALLLQRRKLLFVEVHFSKASTATLHQRRISVCFHFFTYARKPKSSLIFLSRGFEGKWLKVPKITPIESTLYLAIQRVLADLRKNSLSRSKHAAITGSKKGLRKSLQSSPPKLSS